MLKSVTHADETGFVPDLAKAQIGERRIVETGSHTQTVAPRVERHQRDKQHIE